MRSFNVLLISMMVASAVACVALVDAQVAGGGFEVHMIHPDNEAIVSSKKSTVPLTGYEKFVWKQRSSDEDLWINKTAELGTQDLKEARARLLSPPSLPMVDIELTKNGANKLSEISRKNLKKRIAVLLDGKLLTAPIIIEPMTSGKMSFSGDFKPAEVQKIVDRINELIENAKPHSH